MTPNEKANQLTQKYAINTPIGFFIEECKICSLIAVDEILEELFEMEMVTGSSYVHKHIDYWQEVKNEIKKL